MPPRYTLNRFLVDAGMLYVGATPVGWGATRGGLTFEPDGVLREPEADGITTPIDGTLRYSRWNSRITGRLMDATIESMMRLMPGATSDGSSPNNYITPPNARTFITTSQSLENIILIHRNSANQYQATWFPKAIVRRWNKVSPDSDEGTFDIEILALLKSTQSPNECPFREFTNFDLDTVDLTDYPIGS